MRILVIEDEHKIASAIKKGLEQERYAVDLSFSGTEGYDMAIGETYDVIILDRMLPDKDGVTIAITLREQGVHTPILFLTAKGSTEDKVAGLNAGGDDYLSKPFSFTELLARIRALLRRPHESASIVLTVGDLTLNTLTYDVKRNGKSIVLSQKEYALLEFLLRHPGQILSKEIIINHIWNYDDDVLPNTVEVYMGYLRKKIDKSFPQQPPLLHTARGFGYKIG